MQTKSYISSGYSSRAACYDELFAHGDPLHGEVFRVSKLTLGYGYTLPLGGSGSVYAKPGALDTAYGKGPVSFTGFAKLALGR